MLVLKTVTGVPFLCLWSFWWFFFPLFTIVSCKPKHECFPLTQTRLSNSRTWGSCRTISAFIYLHSWYRWRRTNTNIVTFQKWKNITIIWLKTFNSLLFLPILFTGAWSYDFFYFYLLNTYKNQTKSEIKGYKSGTSLSWCLLGQVVPLGIPDPRFLSSCRLTGGGHLL